MIDLHSHILPGIDDGAASVGVAIEMARMAVADGVTDIVCTPHITPGVYDNTKALIVRAVEQLRTVLLAEAITLVLHVGADIHIAPNLVEGLKSAALPTIAGSRYFLLEPPNHVPPPRLLEFAEGVLAAGFVPLLTHPERFGWIEARYDLITDLADRGVLLQVTAGALTGHFGRRPRYWAERLLGEGRVTVVASDAHNTRSRRPILSQARDTVAAQIGYSHAREIFDLRPATILANKSINRVAMEEFRREDPGRRGSVLGMAKFWRAG